MELQGRQLFTSESVTEGHPDKMADQISDSILDSLLEQDQDSRVACEVLVTTGLCLIAGEISTNAYADLPSIARNTIKEIGYTDARYGMDYHSCSVMSTIDEQSRDIAMGVDTGGAGDQGMMFGYACKENHELMPLPISLAHGLTMRLAECRRNGEVTFFRPDGKSQVSVEYQDDKPIRVDSVVISTQHSEEPSKKQIEEAVIETVIKKVIPAEMIDDKTKYYVNPTGRFVTGGPQGDAGLTGRKIIVDTYGGMGHHGGGAFSGKDATKVDRSGSYMARYIAKNMVAAGFGQRVEVQLAYAIGVADPVSVMVNTYGTGKLPEEELVRLVRDNFPLTPAGIIEHLKLKRPVFKETAAYGHFGRTGPGFTWELTDMVERLRKGARG